MARRWSLDVLCDICQAEDIETEGEEIEPTAIGKMKPHVMALCKQHMEVYEAFRDALQAHGAPVENLTAVPAKTPQKTSGGAQGLAPEVCKNCGKEYQYVGSMRTHVKERHNMTLPEMRGELPLPQDAPKITEVVCDVKGCKDPNTGEPVTYTWPDYSRPAQAMGLHKRQAHGIRGATKPKKMSETAS